MDGKGKGRRRPNKNNKSKTTEKATEDDSEVSPEVQYARYEQELYWCIQQLELGLAKQRPDSKQATEAVKILKILRNPNAPVIRKRQAMRNTFGDYRKKMADGERKITAKMQSSQMIKTSKPNPSKSTFIKKSSTGFATRGQSDQQTAEQMIANLDLNPSQQASSGFKFNFNTDNSVDSDMQSESTANNADSGSNNSTDSSSMDTTAVNYFRMQPGANSFTFSFQSPPES